MKYADKIKQLLVDYNTAFDSINITQINNKSDYDTIVISSDPTLYRPKINAALFAKIKEGGKTHYIAFRNKYKSWFELRMIETSSIKSDSEFFRITPDVFSMITDMYSVEFAQLAAQICIDAMSFSTFGCCHLYEECSNAGKCLHSDQIYASSCSYRKNLESGKVFYGSTQSNSIIYNS